MRDRMIPFFMPYCTINNTILHYESIRVTESASEKVILLFLHEALGSIPQWKSFPKDLCSALKLDGIVYERQGHGQSSPLEEERKADYLHRYAYEELRAFIQEVFSPDHKLILVGHSDGGSIALLYASKFPEQVAAVVTIAAHVINEPQTITGIAPAVLAFEQGKLARLNDFHGEKTDALFFAWANTWKSDEFRNWDICKDIGNINFPVLVMQGEKDQYGTKRQMELIQENVQTPCDLILIENAGHLPHLEQKQNVLQVIENWIKTHTHRNNLYI